MDNRFREQVIAEYIEDENRAVAPVYGGGYDLEPVIMHCLQARRLMLFRDLTYCTLGFVSLIFLPIPAFVLFSTFAGLSLALWIWRLIPKGRWRIPLFLAAWQLSGLVVLAPVLFLAKIFDALGEALNESGAGDSYDSYDPGDTGDGLGDWLAGGDSAFVLNHWKSLTFLLLLLFTAIAFGHVMVVFQIMRKTLYPLSTSPPPGSPSTHVRSLLSRITRAQFGNLTIFGRENPFIGAGGIDDPWAKNWAIALELDRKTSKANGSGRRVDPSELHTRVWNRLTQMKSPDEDDPSTLLPNESIVGMERPEMHLVTRGYMPQYPRPLGHGGMMYQGHPLIDSYGVPYSSAGPEAIEAVIRHPQGSLRCYQKIAIDSRGQLVLGRENAVISPAEDQDVATTAFLHFAVEGRMLYVHFAATALTPVRADFKIVDHLPSADPFMLAWWAFRATWKSGPSGTLLAPFRVAKTCVHMALTAFRSSTRNPQNRSAHNYGARISPRELAAEPDFDTYIQVIDTDKYIRLLELRINEAVLDYLSHECCVDVSAYRAQVTAITHSSVTINGGTVNGNVSTGSGSTLNFSAPAS